MITNSAVQKNRLSRKKILVPPLILKSSLDTGLENPWAQGSSKVIPIFTYVQSVYKTLENESTMTFAECPIPSTPYLGTKPPSTATLWCMALGGSKLHGGLRLLCAQMKYYVKLV
jgi:hypothetical protein